MARMRYHLFRSRPHLSAAIVIGAVAGAFLPAHWSPLVRALTAWDIAVWIYLFSVGWMMLRADHRQVKRIAARQDERAATILASLVVATVMSIVAISSELASLRVMPASERGPHYAFVVVTLIGSWFLVGTLFCFHYAHLYYNARGHQRPLAFPGGETQPDYWDFLYFSFTIAVAAQTSDVAVQSAALRKLVLAQSVLSFFFNLLILGLFVNMAASLM
ncbi:DUF1345 domain-containing protein [Pseudoduganella sp. DS3]|uniref:DUF1345 domain-containing protein n=1 Tax=Pseudoduganella guangdongensis TaxID=2692179 RepID=A0A6N9HDL6_9BURK|nr:DUF1345 domain-containing protein [Pseudoduganella guangdongensis]MYN01604.1 DUF1345 domain-containing protein [Pseudoduganella guangdongensis]